MSLAKRQIKSFLSKELALESRAGHHGRWNYSRGTDYAFTLESIESCNKAARLCGLELVKRIANDFYWRDEASQTVVVFSPGLSKWASVEVFQGTVH